MGRFLKGLKRGFQKVKKGVSRGIDNVKKGVKNAKKNIAKIGRLVIDAKAQFVNPIPQGEEARQFNKKLKGKTTAGKIWATIGEGSTRMFKNLQAPAKQIRAIDPLRNTGIGKAGFSPIGLAGDIVYGMPGAIGVIGQAISDPKQRKKIKDGDFDTISELALAPVAFAGMGLGSGATKVAKSAGLRAIQGVAKVASRFG